MNKNRTTSALWGLFMVLVGVAALLYNFGVLDDYKLAVAYVVAALLGLGGLAFLVAIAFQRDRWSFAIPGFSLLALGGIVYLTTLGSVEPQWLGLLFLSGVALGFFVLFLSNRAERWWALLQTGTILTVGIVGLLLVDMLMAAHSTAGPLSVAVPGAVMFGGFALSFLLLYLFAGDRKHFQWALLMTGVLGAFAMILLVAGLENSSVIVRLWPVLLLLLGIYLISRLFTGISRAPAKSALPTLPAEALEGELSGLTPAAEPARIQRPNDLPEPASKPPVLIPESAPEPLPAEIADLDTSDPAAALDALLEASEKVAEDQ